MIREQEENLIVQRTATQGVFDNLRTVLFSDPHARRAVVENV